MTSTSPASSPTPAQARRDPRIYQPFMRLSHLLDGEKPGTSHLSDGAPISLSIGDPQLSAPPLLAETLAAYPNDWSCYPPFRGTPDFRAACHDWLVRRYGLSPEILDADRQILPLPGSREGLFFATLTAINRGAAEGRTKVLIPSPGYHVYAGGALAAGAEPVFVPARADNNFLPDYEGLPKEILDRTAIAFFCSPSNPEGAVASREQWRAWIELAQRHGFVLAADECYADIYTDEPPAGLLEAVQGPQGTEGLLTFHSLSKRSSAAGLRSGFVAGDSELVDGIDAFMRYGGASVPTPVLHASAALWRDEAHVVETRCYYRTLFEMAEEKLWAKTGWRMPAGGFFAWLEVGDGEAFALRAWKEAGLRVLPGRYLCPDEEGAAPEDNPGAPYIRVALVHEPQVTEKALDRLAEML
ncbi:MAG: aminotransferase class I/II-fold pyridoxal phosphate-dependent enzyme [Pseudomonadota bacterium]